MIKARGPSDFLPIVVYQLRSCFKSSTFEVEKAYFKVSHLAGFSSLGSVTQQKFSTEKQLVEAIHGAVFLWKINYSYTDYLN